MSSRSRGAPCFCGSGRPFKDCCLRTLRQVRTLRDPDSVCRWRIWRAFGPGSERILGREAAEHVCGGEFAWIGRTAAGGVSWMLDEREVSLMELLQDVHRELGDWVLGQTLVVVAPALKLGPRVIAGSIDDVLARVEMRPLERLRRDPEAAELAALAFELVRFTRAAEALARRLSARGTARFDSPGAGGRSSDHGPGDPTSDRGPGDPTSDRGPGDPTSDRGPGPTGGSGPDARRRPPGPDSGREAA
jgi:hypothetical protein